MGVLAAAVTPPWLTMVLLAPLVGAVLAWAAAGARLDATLVRRGALAWSTIPLGIVIALWAAFDPQAAGLQFVERMPWVEAIRVEYAVGVDGLSFPLVLLTAALTPLALALAWREDERVATHVALIMVLQAALFGCFVSLNFFFFFVCWELSLIPAYLLIDGWGRDPARRRGAAQTFVIYTIVASLGLLLPFQLVYLATAHAGQPTLDLIELGRLGTGQSGMASGDMQALVFAYLDAQRFSDALGRFPLLYASLLFWAIFVAFAVKLAIWPFHTWLPDAYAEAPVAGSIMLAGVMSKLGAYGMLRVALPLFPEAAQLAAPVVGALALAGVIVGALGALRHAGGDMKRMLAYTSINHMGYVGLAVAAAAAAPDATSRALAIDGALFQLVAHGLSTAALFIVIAWITRHTGSHDARACAGLRSRAPRLAGAAGIAMFANLGLPGLAGFVGEFYIMRAVWASAPLYALGAAVGLVITGLALLRWYGRVFHGAPRGPHHARPVLVEALALAPLLVGLVALGLYPAPILDLINRTALSLAAVLAGGPSS